MINHQINLKVNNMILILEQINLMKIKLEMMIMIDIFISMS